MKATARTVRLTPKKMNLIAEMIRNKDAKAALEILKYTPKKGAKILRKVLFSAVSNAENNFKQDGDSLYVKEVVVGKATTFKRWVPASRGRAQPILKRNTHVTILIGVHEGKEVKKTQPSEKKTGTTGSTGTTKKSAPKKTTAKSKEPATNKVS
ncbi:MAG TPA: 50S ribosomal protein L22 [Candidatus Gracilibacteria bacterium]|nr:50S ribosomal protein L22 [Candidatus Gracilibacteria bacterium]